MKKTYAVLLSFFILLGSFNFSGFAKEKAPDDFWQQINMMVRKYEERTHFSTMTVTIGENMIDLDGELIPIDESNSVPFIEHGRTMMPVRGLAEAIGAEVSYDNATRTVRVQSDENLVLMTVGKDKMQVNGTAVELVNPPQIVNNRTMLPVRDVAEALDCEVEWIDETKTAVFTKPLQTKRIIAYSEKAEHNNALTSVRGHGMTVLQFDSVNDTREALKEMEIQGISAEPDYVRKADAMSWGVEKIGSEKYHKYTAYASGSATVAVIDTGIDLSHEYFNGRLVNGYDIFDNDRTPEDNLGHGTHVAGTVLDVAGFNPNVLIMPVKVFGTAGTTYSSLIAAGIEYATDNGADVINLSVGGQHKSDVEQQAIYYANSKNVAVIAAAGNEKLDLRYNDYSPAGLDGVITVSATDENGNLAYFSNYGDGIIDFAAPGVNINGVRNGGGRCVKSGTSMASPHVAGAYALIKAVHKDMPVKEITEGLKDAAEKLGSSNYFGAGQIFILNAESKLSTIYSDDETVTDVTESNAVIKGEISYEGIRPEYIGVRIGYTIDDKTDIYKIPFPKGSKKTDFICDINKDAGVILKPGTTYYVSIFIKPAGMDYVTPTMEFTTKGVIEPPAPEPVKSELRILPEAYPKGELTQGKNFNLSGRIKSDCHITDVRSYLLNENKSVVQEASGWTTTQTYVIEGSALDKNLKFENLTPGRYYLQYRASDESGNTVTWISDIFTVAAVPQKSELRILPEAYPIGSLSYGKTFNLSGRIKSDYHITDVRAYILNANMNVVMEASGWTTTQTYVIEGSALDKGMKFNNLSRGGYYLKYQASDESGNTVSWISDIFYVN